MNKKEPCITRRKYAYLSPMILGLTLQANSHATETTTTTIAVRAGTPQTVTVERMNDVAVAQGDLIVGYADSIFSSLKRTKGLSNTVYGAIWPNGIVPYTIDPALSSAATTRIRDAIAHWNSIEAVSIIERNSSNASAFPNYIHFIDENQCASWVGFQNTGPQSIYSGDNCSTGSMIHEIGHALGLLHEHTRPDRDSFVSVNWQNISNGKEHNFEILSDGLPLGNYDYGSIMHYGERFFSANGAATLQPITATSATIGQREKASTGDKESVSELYQTNLALIAKTESQNVEAGSQIQLSLYVTNQSSVGANNLEITLPVPAKTSLLSYSSSQWLCMQAEAGDNVNCQSTVLTGAADSALTLDLRAPDITGSVTVEASLLSLTDDTDSSNNSDSVSFTVIASDGSSVPVLANNQPIVSASEPEPETEPETEPAESPSGTISPFKIAAAQSGGNGGGGSIGLPFLLMLPIGLLLSGLRRNWPPRNERVV